MINEKRCGGKTGGGTVVFKNPGFAKCFYEKSLKIR